MNHKLEPFEKVLVRDSKALPWKANFFSHYQQREDGTHIHICTQSYFTYCIPYAGNEHLLGTTDSPEPKHEYKWGDKVEYLNSLNAWEQAIFIQKMIDDSCLLVIRRRSENVFYGVENDKIRPLKEDK